MGLQQWTCILCFIGLDGIAIGAFGFGVGAGAFDGTGVAVGAGVGLGVAKQILKPLPTEEESLLNVMVDSLVTDTPPGPVVPQN